MADTPGTRAGRSLVGYVYGVALVANRETSGAVRVAVSDAILAIEAEAIATYRAALREQVAGLWHPGNGWVDRELVLTLLEDTPDVG